MQPAYIPAADSLDAESFSTAFAAKVDGVRQSNEPSSEVPIQCL